MRAFIVAVTILLLAAPAYSQGMRGGNNQRGSEQKTELKNKPDDKAYKAALDKIPTPDQKPDPWANVRPNSAVPSVKTGR